MKLSCEIDKRNVIRQENVDKKSTKKGKFNDERKIKKSKNRKIESTTSFFCYICVNLMNFLKFDFWQTCFDHDRSSILINLNDRIENFCDSCFDIREIERTIFVILKNCCESILSITFFLNFVIKDRIDWTCL